MDLDLEVDLREVDPDSIDKGEENNETKEEEEDSGDDSDDDPEGLNLYEIHRKPLELLPHSTTIRIPIRDITQEFTCPICLNMLTKTYTTMECLHRFCQQCLAFSVSKSNKRECPSCRARLPSMRNARADTSIDNFIDTLFPDRDEFEAHMESLITRISADANNSARLLQQRVEEGLRRQSLAKKQRGLKKGELYVKLERHPATKLRNLQLPWAKVTQQATVQTVRKLLSKIHHQTEERWTDVGLIVKPTLDANVATSSSSCSSPESIPIPEKANELDETLSLSSVYQKYCKSIDRKVEFLYWLKSSSSSEETLVPLKTTKSDPMDIET